jgi:hypothetical protein
VRRLHYRGNKWVPFVWAILLFPVTIVLFAFNAVWIEEEITHGELDQLPK